MIIDLHLHSFYSDGAFSPAEVINLASKRGVTLVSLTDHDCILGLETAKHIAEFNHMTFINGVELEAYIDISSGKYIHLLAYNFKDIKKLSEYLSVLRFERIELIKKYLKLLQSQNFNVSFCDINSLSPGIHLTSSHIAVWLYKNGFYNSFDEAKRDYLLPTSPYYIKTNYHTIEEVIKLVIDCGATPVLAHPYRIGYTKQKLDDFVGYLKTLGLVGIETYYTTHSQEEIEFCLKLAAKYSLISTGGSDWHDFSCDLPGVILP